MHGPNGARKVTAAEYYAGKLQIRSHHLSILHHAQRLFHQYIVDNYIKIEAERLGYLRRNQSIIRAECYRDLHDTIAAGETNAQCVGKMVVLPSSFTGGPRDMHQRFQDAMALVQRFGKPDLFNTVTCNPHWPEIHDQLLPCQTPADRPDLTSRVFRAKLMQLNRDLLVNHVLGQIVANIYVIEFQKRGLPHAHLLLILAANNKLQTPDQYDSVVCTEIPNAELQPRLHTAVLKHMIHGPCGVFKRSAACMRDGSCSKQYPRGFFSSTQQGSDSYPVYRRRDDGQHASVRGVEIDNRWVVPYNPYLLLKYNCHINVEICASIKAIKYLYKYIYKGHDRATVEVDTNQQGLSDEIKQFVDARWISAPEACWRILKFDLACMAPSIYRLQLHLPETQNIHFLATASLEVVAANPKNARTMLTKYFDTNRTDITAREFLYREFPEHYTWNKASRTWSKRNAKHVIGRLYTSHPLEGKRYFLRLLLNHVRGAQSFEDLRHGCATFRESAQHLGLLEMDNGAHVCMSEAAQVRMPRELRQLFCSLLFAEVSNPCQLLDAHKESMMEDYIHIGIHIGQVCKDVLLSEISQLLEPHERTLADFGLPQPCSNALVNPSSNRLILEELRVPVKDTDFVNIYMLNQEQRAAFDDIISHVSTKLPAVFFIDGPAGSGKTFLYRSFLAHVRSLGFIAIATASSGISAILMPGGRTAHSRFKIPISADQSSTCNIRKQSTLADLLSQATLLIWDEAPMTHRHALEAVDRTFRDLFASNLPFGGKILVLGGNFRQVLPVIPKATRLQLVAASIRKSLLWKDFKLHYLRSNMRAQTGATTFRDFLLQIGDGSFPKLCEDFVQIPDEMVVSPRNTSTSPENLIMSIYPDLELHASDSQYFEGRGILAATHEHTKEINSMVLDKFPGQPRIYYSYDSVVDDLKNLYPQEFLNSIAPGGLLRAKA